MLMFKLSDQLQEGLDARTLQFLEEKDTELVKAAQPYGFGENMRTQYLTEPEQVDFTRCETVIGDLLAEYSGKNETDKIMQQLNFIQLEVGLWPVISKLKNLAEKVNTRKIEDLKKEEKRHQEEEQRKVEEAEAERRKKEAEERRAAARKAIKPPIDDAKRYLNRPGEYDKFIQSIEGAIDAYLAEPEGYLDNMKAHKYKWCLIEISDRRQEEAQRLRATLAANEYNHCLNQEIAKLTSQLEHKRKDLSSYFRAKIQDKRHTNHNFDYVLSKEEEINFDRTLVRIANKKLEQIIPDSLREFIDIPSQYYRIYFPLPSIDYSLEGIPCLNFCFDVFVAAYAEIQLKPGKKSFGGYEFHLPRIEEKNYSVLLQEPKFLGYYYLVLRPEELGGYSFWHVVNQRNGTLFKPNTLA